MVLCIEDLGGKNTRSEKSKKRLAILVEQLH